MFSFPFGPVAVGTPTLTSLLPLKESISSVPCWVRWYLGQGVEGWLLLCCQRLGVEALCWNLLSSGRRVGEESCQLAPLLTSWFNLIRSVQEWRLSPLGCADPCGEERNRSRVSTKLGWVLASHWPYWHWWGLMGRNRVSSSSASSGLNRTPWYWVCLDISLPTGLWGHLSEEAGECSPALTRTDALILVGVQTDQPRKWGGDTACFSWVMALHSGPPTYLCRESEWCLLLWSEF